MGKTWIATTAGILDIVAGSFRLIIILFIALVMAVFVVLMRGDTACFQQFPIAITASVLIVMALFSLIISILSILGGIYALRRKNWGIALAGSIAAFFCSFPLGVAAIIFTALSKSEFK